ncbi:MAG: ABC transporter ATP-binding protein, partial [Firmicutes bacterium]|nr:ABC transporter ATP-binding protein [Bacillota bacterium]
MAPGPGGHGPVHFMTDEEKQQVPKVTKSLLLRIASYLKPYKFQFALVFITILLSAAIGLLPSIITGRIVDQALVGKNLQLLVKLLIAAFATMALSQIIGVLESYINAWISSRIIFDMKNQMYAHLQSMPHSFFTTEKQGDIIT